MKFRLSHFILLYIFYSIPSSPEQLTQEHQDTLTVVAIENSLPFSFSLPDGTPTGLYVEFWKLWSETNNIPIRFILLPFEEGLPKIRQKNRLHAGLFWSVQREQWADFSLPIHNVQTGVIYNRSISKDTKLRELQHKKISSQYQSFQDTFLKENYAHIEQTTFKGFDEGIEQLLDNKVQAIIAELPTVNAELAKKGLSGVFVTSNEIIVSNDVFGVIAKGQPELLARINAGIENIPVNKIIALEKKWLPTLKPFFSQGSSLASLTLAEKKWLQQHTSLNLGADSWYPYEFFNEKGEYSGISADYIEHISNSLSIDIQANKTYSWTESLTAIKNNKIDIISAIVRTKEREKSMLFTVPYISTPTVLVSSKNGFYANSLESLTGKSIGAVANFAELEFIATDYPEINIVPVLSTLSGLKKLSEGEIDAYIADISIVNFTINEAQLSNLIISGFSPYKLEISMAVRTGLEPLVGILNKVFLAMSEKEKTAIANNWLSIRVNTGTNISTIILWVLPIILFLMLIIFIFVRMNKDLKISQTKFRNMFENADISIWNEDMSHLKLALDQLRTTGVDDLKQFLIDHPNKVLEFAALIKVNHVNKATLDMFKAHTTKDFISRIPQSFGPGANEVFAKELCAIWNGEKAFRSETSFITQEGKHIDAILSFYIPVSNEGFNSVSVSIVDITLQKQVEKEILKSKKLESVGLLAGGIAHDFNNIMTGLFGNLELAKIKLSPDHASYHHIQTANQALNTATNLTHQLLTFAKGGDPLFEIVNVKQIIEDSLKLSLSGSNISSVLLLQDDLWMISADKGQLSQVIINLLINADHAMSERGSLTIEANNIEKYSTNIASNLSGKFICIKISDDGEGISQEALKHIFDPYFTTKQFGSGLGLATAHSIVAKHNGTISVESERGKGTTFSLYFPAKPEAQIRNETILNKPKKSLESSAKVLVMDDEKIILNLATEMLKSLGYSVDTAIDGEQAIDKYKAANKEGRPFDVIIMDLTIPNGMGGEETIKQLLKINPQIKVIVSSGYSTGQIMSNYRDYGFKARLVKPFLMKDLEYKLFKILEK